MSVLDDPLATEVEPAPSARPATTPGLAWRAARAPVLIALGALLAAVVVVVVTGSPGHGELDPGSATPDGARAVVTLLRDRGVSVTRTAAWSGRTDRTVVVPIVDYVDPDDLRAVARSEADLVVVGADRETLEYLGVADRVNQAGHVATGHADPACSLPEARVAGEVRVGGSTYSGEDGSYCYASGDRGWLAVLDDGPRRLVLVGDGAFLTNERLDEEGNAALALGLLSGNDAVEWLRPRPAELGAVPEDADSLSDLMPDRIDAAVLQLLLAFVLAALWRARRLGPVVTEPLPVVVRAAEAVEGSGRLYRAARARDRAASVLRQSVRDRAVHALGLAATAPREAVVPAVAAHAGRPPQTVDDLLYGPPPSDDAGLVRLAAALDTLDSEVRRS